VGKYTNQDIQELVSVINGAPKGVALLTGAGCSLTAGMPLASTLVTEIHERHPHIMDRFRREGGDPNNYGACMGQLSLKERRALLSPYLDNVGINWAHIAIAALMQKGLVKRVMTFNFDSVLAKACGLLGVYPATYDFGVSPSSDTGFLSEPCIIHLHGQGYGPVMKNADRETAKHANKLGALISNTLSSYPLIVVGYSGEADPVYSVISRRYRGEHRFYWLGHSEEPKEHLDKLFGERRKTAARYLGGADADESLVTIAQDLECFPPQVFADPAAHLLSEISEVEKFPLGQAKARRDLLEDTRARLEKHRGDLKMPDMFSAALAGDSETIFEVDKKVRRRTSRSAAKALSKATVEPDKADDTSQELVAWAHFSEGTKLAEAAAASRSAVGYRSAIRELSKAVGLQPRFAEALNNWGHALAGLGRLRNDEKLFLEAFEKFDAAHKLMPEDSDTLENWGLALLRLGGLGDEDDPALYLEAEQKLRAALDLRPDNQDALFALAYGLRKLGAGSRDPVRRQAYLAEANEILLRREATNPSRPYNHACVLALLGEEEACRAYLERGRLEDSLPSAVDMAGDEDLAAVRGKPWFRELLAAVERKRGGADVPGRPS
jgi:tetratricopeptide (TPR) repeat protein